MNLLRNGLLMRKTGDRRRTDMTEICAFLCGFSVEFITLSRGIGAGLCRILDMNFREFLFHALE